MPSKKGKKDDSNTQEDNCSNADSGQKGTKTCQMKSPENKPGKLHDLELKGKLAIDCDKSEKDNGSKRGEFDDLELQEKSSAVGTDDSTGSNNTEIHVLELEGGKKPDESDVGTRIKGRELYIDTNKKLSIIGNDDESESKGAERLDLELQEKPTTGGSDDNAESKKRELRAIQLRLAAICMVWVFAFTAYSGLQNLESSLNARVGTYALAGLTGGGFLTCLLAPAVISKIGCKGALIISWVCLCVFVGANYYPRSYVLISGAVVEGLATGLMWTAQGVYVTDCASQYSQISGEPFEEVLSRMFGIFCMAFQSTQVWGNLISSVVLHKEQQPTSNTSHSTVRHCGADHCPDVTSQANVTSPSSSNPEDSLMVTLISVYMGFVIVGLIVTIFFLKPIKKSAVTQHPGTVRLLTSTVRHLVSDVNMLLLVPFSLYLGMEQAVLFAEFTMAYVTCELGVDWVGYAMLCFGICDTVASPVAGILGKYVKRIPLLFGATCLNATTLICMLLWQPKSSEKYIFFLLPAVWGIADGIWQTQSGALIGSIFRDQQEASFANLRMFQALGFTIAYLYSGHLCVAVKLYIALVMVVLSFCLVVVVEMRARKKKHFKYGQM